MNIPTLALSILTGPLVFLGEASGAYNEPVSGPAQIQTLASPVITRVDEATPAAALPAAVAPAEPETCVGVIPWTIRETNLNTGITTVRTMFCTIDADGHVRLVSP